MKLRISNNVKDYLRKYTYENKLRNMSDAIEHLIFQEQKPKKKKDSTKNNDSIKSVNDYD